MHILRFPIRVIQSQFLIANGKSIPNENALKFYIRRYRRWHYGIQSSNPDIIFHAEKGEQELLKVLGISKSASGLGKQYNSKLNKPYTVIDYSTFNKLNLGNKETMQ